MLKRSRLLTLLLLWLASMAACSAVPVDGEDPTVNDAPSYDCSGPSSTGDSFIDYDHLVHCTPLLQSSPVLAKATLIMCLVLLLYLLSSTADEFFCPVLQAIVEKYRIPPHVAGVTFLSFGNGSPDVFSNIAAFATPMPSIGVTSILGGGLLVTTVITACVGLVSDGQDQLIPRTFLRDVVFYLIAVLYLGLVFFDGKVGLLEAVGFLCIYLVYVLVVFSDKYLASWCFPSRVPEDSIYAGLDDDDDLQYCSSSSMSEKSPVESPLMLLQQPTEQKRRPYLKSQTIPVYDTFNRTHIFSDSEQSEPSPRFLDRLLYRKSSLPTPRSAPHISDELGAIEGYHTRALSDIEEFSPSAETGEETSEDETQRKELEAKEQVAEDERLALEAIMAVSFVARVKVFTVFLRRLTIPLVDEDTWDKNLVVVCPPFAMLLFGVSVFSFSFEDPVFLMTVVVLGGMFSAIIEYSTSPLAPPDGWQLALLICLAFVMSVIWIMNVANEVLSVLETLGQLFGISSSVLGVSVLAWGNSIGDLVSNMAIARDGFPTMAFAGCFAGPMFNLLVGIGLSLTIAIISRGPLSMGEPSPLVYLSFGYLLLSLLLNIGIASYDGFRYRPRLCYTLLALYTSFAVISIAVVLNYPEE
ncbi:hypothetical protein JG687_00008590 [Phytophthora cactorum]|uniref:Sodium/calcium exchanger membrane region domain-containing protein n=1 Tax=Phytophthora cactorum TaxID=29920 RepID=A0A8T1UEC9_9STRA|nr:hypothetical protein JG687_00008590 [Phytophthora cactorum]